MADKAKIDGVTIKLGDTEYILPPIPLVKMPKIKTLMNGGDMTDEFVGALIDAIHWSLQRNYPEIARDDVENAIDMVNWKEIMNAFMATNGFAPTGEPKSGEAQAVVSTT